MLLRLVALRVLHLPYCKLTQFQRPFALVFVVSQYWCARFTLHTQHPFPQWYSSTATRLPLQNYFWITKPLDICIVLMISFRPHCCWMFIEHKKKGTNEDDGGKRKTHIHDWLAGYVRVQVNAILSIQSRLHHKQHNNKRNIIIRWHCNLFIFIYYSRIQNV